MSVERLIVGLVALIIGSLFCFAGYRLFRIITAIWGFLIGFLIGTQVIPSLLGGDFANTALAWIAGVLLGLILAMLAYALYAAAVTILGASIGYILGTGLMAGLGLGNQETLVVVVGLILAGLFAILILALDLVRLLIVANTALSGAGALIVGILLLLGPLPLNFLNNGLLGTFIKDSPGWLLLWLLFAVIGGVVQLQSTRNYTLERYALARKGSTFYGETHQP